MVLTAYRNNMNSKTPDTGENGRFIRVETALEITSTGHGRKILVMPALCIGNVGQLAIDLVLEAKKKDSQHAAVLKHPSVLPCYGPNPFQEGISSETTTADNGIESQPAHPLDLYQISSSDKASLFVLQQRAPAAAGCQMSFGSDLMSWLSGSVDEVWILGSLDASYRHDDDIACLDDAPFRYVASDEGNDSCTQLMGMCDSHGIRSLYGETSEGWYRKVAQDNAVHMPWALLSAAKNANIPAIGLLAFVVEGDNRRDGHAMAKQILDLLHEYVGQETQGCLKEPPSWDGSL